MRETLHFQGILKIRRLPEDWTPAQFRYWWCPQVDGQGRVISPARLSEREKARWTEVEAENLLMVAGRTQILTYLGASGGNATGFCKYLAVGTGALMYPTPTDATLVNEAARTALVSSTVQGTQVDASFQFTSGAAQVTMTEAGIFGGAASGTRNSGTLYTHVLFSYVKGAWSIAADYVMTLL